MDKKEKKTNILMYHDGGSYSGNLKEGKRHGDGSMKFSNFDTYVGNWNEGDMEGFGEYRFYDLDTDKYHGVYKGLFHQNLFDGYGELETRQETYRGFWKENMRNGEGVCVFQDGSCLHGLWEDDLVVQGELLLGNGDRYDGQFSDGLFNGIGKYYWKEGDWFSGLFKDGRPFKGIKVKSSGDYVIINSDEDKNSVL